MVLTRSRGSELSRAWETVWVKERRGGLLLNGRREQEGRRETGRPPSDRLCEGNSISSAFYLLNCAHNPREERLLRVWQWASPCSCGAPSAAPWVLCHKRDRNQQTNPAVREGESLLEKPSRRLQSRHWRGGPQAAPLGEWPGARGYVSLGGKVWSILCSLGKDRNSV